MGKEKSNYEQAILSYYDAQVYGVYLPCPRCGKLRMKRRAITNAFSRYAPIYVCDTCGNEEAVEVARSGKHIEEDNKVHLDKVKNWFLFKNVYRFPELTEHKDKFKISVQREIELSREDIDDIMSAAFDGGITYWCKKVEVIESTYYGAYASEQIARGGSLRLYDAESSDVWELTLDKFLTGLSAAVRLGYAEKNNWLAGDNGDEVDTCQIDADGADVIIQLAIFGDVIFG